MLALDDSWPAVATSVGKARSAIGAFGAEAGLEDGLVHNLKVAVSEAATNVVLHAYVGREVSDFAVRVRVQDGRIEVVVRDWGRGMIPRPDSPGLGLGLPLIANLADSLEVAVPDDGGTELRMRFSLPI